MVPESKDLAEDVFSRSILIERAYRNDENEGWILSGAGIIGFRGLLEGFLAAMFGFANDGSVNNRYRHIFGTREMYVCNVVEFVLISL